MLVPCWTHGVPQSYGLMDCNGFSFLPRSCLGVPYREYSSIFVRTHRGDARIISENVALIKDLSKLGHES